MQSVRGMRACWRQDEEVSRATLSEVEGGTMPLIWSAQEVSHCWVRSEPCGIRDPSKDKGSSPMGFDVYHENNNQSISNFPNPSKCCTNC